MTDLTEEKQKAFLEELFTLQGTCQCGYPDCTAIIYEAQSSSGCNYLIEHDVEEATKSNILVYSKTHDNIVFNGKCDTEHDIALALRMVII